MIKDLKNLVKLDLSKNKIYHFSSNKNTSKIKSLNLSRNKIGYIDYTLFLGLTDLNELFLDACGIKKIKENTFINLKLIKTLNIQLNPVPFTELVNALRSLHIYNKIENLKLGSTTLNRLDRFTFESLNNSLSIKSIDLQFIKISYFGSNVFVNFPNLISLTLLG